jgi:hypothetical protein
MHPAVKPPPPAPRPDDIVRNRTARVADRAERLLIEAIPCPRFVGWSRSELIGFCWDLSEDLERKHEADLKEKLRNVAPDR